MPGRHVSQAVLPVVPAYLPAAQGEQTLAPALGPEVPPEHGWHAADEAAPVPALNLPASQLEHAPEKLTAVLYFPEVHAVHTLRPVLAAKVPAAQLSQTMAPGFELNRPAWHAAQVLSAAAPSDVLNFPVRHWVQAPLLDAPTALLKLPAPHGVHPVSPPALV